MSNKIGRWQGAGLLTTTLLGTGVFILPQMTVDIAGQWAAFAWGMLTLAILPVAWVFATLSGNFPHSAGPAFFVEKAFGEAAGKTIGMIFVFVVPLGAPAALIMTYQFVEVMFHTQGIISLLVQLGFLLFIFMFNFRGIQLSATLQLGLTLMITVLVVMMAAAASLIDLPVHPSPSQHHFSQSFSAAGLAFWSFLGIEALSHLANDFKNPKRDLIPAIIIGIVLVGLIYVGCTYLVYFYSNDELLPMVTIFNTLFGDQVGNIGAYVIGILGIGGGLASVNVYTASLTRLVSSFANDGYLPRYLAKKNSAGISVTSLVTSLVVMASIIIVTYFTDYGLETLVSWVNGVFVLIYFASMLAAFKLLGKQYAVLITLGCGFCLMLLWGLGWKMAYGILLVVLVYPIVRLKQSRLKEVGVASR